MAAFEKEHNLTEHEFVIYNDYSASNGVIHAAEDLQADLIRNVDQSSFWFESFLVW
jgi:hypothetical protein